MLKDTEKHRLGTGYAQGGILSKLLGIEVFRHDRAIAVTGYEVISKYTATTQTYKDIPGENLFL